MYETYFSTEVVTKENHNLQNFEVFSFSSFKKMFEYFVLI
jgi:hypothetical protein